MQSTSTRPIEHIAVLGTSTLARQISIQAARKGYDVIFFEERRSALDACMAAIRRSVAQLVEERRIAEGQVVMDRIFATTDVKMAARNADLVVDALPEPPEAKVDVLAEVDALCLSHTLFVTTTQIPLPFELAHRTNRADKVLSVRFYPPIWDSTVMDVMPHAETSDETTAAVMRFARTLGLTPQLRLRAGWRQRGQMLSIQSGQA